ncbi:hypothetical protein [Streptomyces violascens]|nr:hypothetical protein [Streptomyces violascens]
MLVTIAPALAKGWRGPHLDHLFEQVSIMAAATPPRWRDCDSISQFSNHLRAGATCPLKGATAFQQTLRT